MIFVRYLLLPFSILYGFITSARNFLFDKEIFKSYSFDIPIIAVGNLSVGGTGKTPQIEYLIRLLSPNYKIATISRGYKRKSKGFILANENSTAQILGDEPFQIHQKHKKIKVAVDANRKNAVEQLLKLEDKPQIILLDDAYQHRKIKAGFYILLTAYDDLFYNDFMLPTGNLRENKTGAKRANIIIVTKCPNNLSKLEQENITKKIGLKIPLFFSFIAYDDMVFNELESKSVAEIKNIDKLLLAGIAKPKPFFDYLKSKNDVVLEFSDHHNFTNNDIQKIKQKSKNNIIITTEKDYVRLKNKDIKRLFYLPIKCHFLDNQNNFNKIINNYVEQSAANG